MAKEEKEEATEDLELNEFLSEMVSLVKKRLDKEDNRIKKLEKRVSALEKENKKLKKFKKKFKELKTVKGDLLKDLEGK